ncbi:tetratricopeptide repeat protein [Morganella sp. EGD-HP17]|uniref:tetratricopeptide repeat protein n=1 Tax=Morganella sp. EGD-HP17 TaxID=1435146 RepID=UPI00044725C4|nr:tetratricopeptide repeat protein [Morganella sp. EGD-HP17]ETO41372.1 hypothetical protein X965_10620 [Morganella sp. EGD-HP17]
MKIVTIFLAAFLFSSSAMSATSHDYFNDVKAKAEKGDPEAQYNLSISYRVGQGVRQDMKKSMQWLEISAKNGYVKAQNWLGFSYLHGKDVPQNYDKALKWLTTAGKQGDEGSLFILAGMYEEGNGVKKDISRAKEYYGVACDNGSQIGCNAYKELNQQGY